MPLSKPGPRPEAYAAHLTFTLHWLQSLHQWLKGFSDGPQDERLLPTVDRLSALQDDLAELANYVPPGSWTVSDLPVRGEEDSPAFRWGVCYVIEGSQLGGLVLERQLCASTPASQIPRRYLGGSGAEVRLRWRRFLRILRQEVTKPQEIEAACRGAVWAFGLIRQMTAEVRLWEA